MKIMGALAARSLAAAAAAIVALPLSSAMALAAPAASAARPARAPVPPGTAIFSAISCKGTWCMAVGHYTDRRHVKHALAETWNGTRWRRVANPPGRDPLNVTCSASWFCLVQGGPTGLIRWNGHTWRELARPPRGTGGISCGSRSLCMAINGRFHHGVVESWNGRTWRIWKNATNACGGPPGDCGLARVSCGSRSNCVAVGTETISQEPVQEAVGFFWNGSRWAFSAPPSDGNPAAANSVACAGRFCMSVGGGFSEVANGGVAVAGAFNATTRNWRDVSPALGTICTGTLVFCFWDTIACGSAKTCMAFGGLAGLQFWNGATWAPAPAIADPALHINPVACGASFCMAVGSRTVGNVRHTLAELWNGSAWRIVRTPSPR
jgi:hypothetical protein